MSVRYGQGIFVCNPVHLLAAPSHLDVSRDIAGVNSGRLIFASKYLNSNSICHSRISFRYSFGFSVWETVVVLVLVLAYDALTN